MEIYPQKMAHIILIERFLFVSVEYVARLALFFVYESVNCVLSSMFILFYKNENFQGEHLF